MSAGFTELPERLGAHVALVFTGLGLGVLVAVPLVLLVHRRPRFRAFLLAFASVTQTVPGLALLALMVPALVAARRVFGADLPAFGFLPTVLALALYSLLPLVRNALAGLAGVDASVVDAARGLGMSDRQLFWQIEVPLAMPVVLAGVRTATTWVVGLATLSTPVGQTSLGNYLFGGLQTRNTNAVLLGCAASAVLALSLDGAMALLEQSARLRSRVRLALGAIVLASIFAGGTVAWRYKAGSPAVRAIRVGSKVFTEQYVLASLIASRLASHGVTALRVDSLGSAVVLDALLAGDVDVYVDYDGTLWANALHRTDTADGRTVQQAVGAWLAARGGQLLGPLGFENAYALAMRRERAGALGVSTLRDVAAHAPSLRLGSDYEFFARPEWTSVKRAYDLHFARETSFDPSVMYDALARGEADVITAFSSDGRIAADDLVLLGDPAHALPPYDAVVLLSHRAANDPRVLDALRPLIASVPVDAMRTANSMVDARHASPEDAAAWLGAHLAHATP